MNGTTAESGMTMLLTVGWWRRRRMVVAVLAALAGMGCSLDGLLNSDQLPKNVSDPAFTQTAEGARAAYVGTLAQFSTAFGGQNSAITNAGVVSDELISQTQGLTSLDMRTLPEGVEGTSYSALQKVRGQAGQAIGLLARYLPDQPVLIGHLYALQGYAELFLAELYCSGVPLGTLDFEGDFTYRPGATTEAVLAHAVALFDTALTFVNDSARFVDLARVGRGRALLNLGNYVAAAAAVAEVTDGYRYNVNYSADSVRDASGRVIAPALNFAQVNANFGSWGFTVPDREGENGLDWRTSGDPRTTTTHYHPNSNANFDYPNKYDTVGSSPILLASGIEARLIAAEAQLQAGDPTWLTTLNALRTDGAFMVDTQVVSVDNTVTPPDTTFTYDTLWHRGSGGYDGLAPLTDPGATAGRVDLLFRERAFWLFLTGHRQGDLRRLIRQYTRRESDVYPVGTYPGTAFPYGSDVTIPIPTSEYVNPLYTGCLSRGA